MKHSLYSVVVKMAFSYAALAAQDRHQTKSTFSLLAGRADHRWIDDHDKSCNHFCYNL